MNSSKYRDLIIGIVLGLIAGLLLGMLLFWQLFPVKWTDAQPYDLSPAGKATYMALVADSFKLDRDAARARQFLGSWTADEMQQAVGDAIQNYEGEGLADKVQAVRDLAMALGIREPVQPIPTPPPVESAVTGIWDRLRVPCLVFVLVLLALVLAAFGWRYLSQRRGTSPGYAPWERNVPAPRREEPLGPGGEPLGPFVATYQLGSATYDESFPIETPGGEFLGECGMGISEAIGIGEMDKVTAFEVWLFDKSDIRTVTKVLMSDYAFHDDELQAKLESKGETVLAQVGKSVFLETGSLRVQVAITDLVYGEEELPPRSYFERFAVEMVAMPQSAVADADTIVA
jgi:hypothetical protein